MIDWGFIYAGLTLLLQWSAAKKYLKRGDVPVRYGSCSKAAAAAILNSTSKPGESASRSVAVETARMSKQSSKIWAPVSLVCSILLFVPQYGYLNQLNPNLNKSWTGRPSHIGAAQPGQPRSSRASHRHQGMTFSCFSPSIISASTSFSTETCPRDPWVKSWGAPINHGLVFGGLHIFGTIWMFTIRGDGVIEKYFNWFCWLIHPWGCCFRGCPLHAAPAIGGTAGAQSMLRMRQNPRAPEVDLQAWAGVGFLLNYIELLEICTKGCGYSVHIMAQKSRIMVGP